MRLNACVSAREKPAAAFEAGNCARKVPALARRCKGVQRAVRRLLCICGDGHWAVQDAVHGPGRGWAADRVLPRVPSSHTAPQGLSAVGRWCPGGSERRGCCGWCLPAGLSAVRGPRTAHAVIRGSAHGVPRERLRPRGPAAQYHARGAQRRALGISARGWHAASVHLPPDLTTGYAAQQAHGCNHRRPAMC